VLGVVTGFAIIASVVLVGYVVSRMRLVGDNAEYVANRLAFFVAIPALLFHTLAEADVHVVFSGLLAVAVLSAATVALCYIAIARLAFRQPFADTVIGALSASYVNANNIGLPVAVYVLGAPSLVAPVLLFQLLVYAPLALTVLDMSSGGGASFGRMLSQPLRNPMIIAAMAGIVIALTGWQPPSAVMAPFVLIGGAAVPLVLMAYGMSLHGAVPFRAGSGRREVALASLLKVVLMPTIAWLLARFVFGFTGEALFATVILAALPTAQNVYNYAHRYDRQVVVARDAVLVASVAAIPAMVVIAALLA
jgi:malonate transporter